MSEDRGLRSRYRDHDTSFEAELANVTVLDYSCQTCLDLAFVGLAGMEAPSTLAIDSQYAKVPFIGLPLRAVSGR